MAGPPSGFTEVTCNFSGSGLNYPAACTFGFDEPSGSGPVAAEFLALIFETLHKEISCTTVQLDSIDLKYGPEATGPTYTHPIAVGGEVSNDSCGPSVAFLVRKPVPGLSSRLAGRVYWPGVPAAWVTENGTLTGVGPTTAQTAFDDLYDAITGSAGLTGWVFPSDGGTPRLHTDYQVQARVATQRRRLRR